MAKTIGGQSYADDIEAILKDKDLLECVENWAHARQPLAENLLMFIQTKMTTERIYEHFLKIGAAHTLDLRLTDKLVDAMNALAGEENWKHVIWKSALKDMRADAVKTFDSKYLPKFWDSSEFDAYHGSEAAKAIGNTASTAREMGVADNEAFRKLMLAAQMGSQKDIKKYSEQVADNQKVKETSGTFFARLKKKMGIRN